jgi:thioredoxin 1
MKYLFFSSTWCQPCKTLRPIMEEVSKQIPVSKIDIDTNPQYTVEYNVRSVPTVVLVENTGKELSRSIGVHSLEHYINQYNQFNQSI